VSRRGAGATLLGLALAGCATYEVPTFDAPLVLGGVTVAPDVLGRGAATYLRTCRPCHGHLGDGHGPLAVGMDPPPRDLRLGVAAFASVPAGSLWRDEDLVRIVRGGLAGTAMRAWPDLTDRELGEVIQFVKTLAPRFRSEVPAEPVEVTPDPWAGREAEGASRGKAVYHGLARCQACHPAHATAEEIAGFARAAGVTAEARPDPTAPRRVPSDFGRPLLATDLRVGPLRSVRRDHRATDLYRAIAAGLGGTAMPTWKGALPEADLWALVHYVDALSRGP